MTSAFTRTGYSRVDRPHCVVVEFISDESVAAKFPHGNAMMSGRNYIRTQSHVLRDITSSSSESAKQIYTVMVNDSSSDQSFRASALPRNSKQVHNVLQERRYRHRPTHDSLFNLIELSYDTNFIHHLVFGTTGLHVPPGYRRHVQVASW